MVGYVAFLEAAFSEDTTDSDCVSQAYSAVMKPDNMVHGHVGGETACNDKSNEVKIRFGKAAATALLAVRSITASQIQAKMVTANWAAKWM